MPIWHAGWPVDAEVTFVFLLGLVAGVLLGVVGLAAWIAVAGLPGWLRG